MTKAIALRALSSVPSLPALPGIFHLTLVRNTGVAFGLLRGCSLPVALVTTGIVLWLLWSASGKGDSRQAGGMSVALGLILGGAMGNLLDRIRFGAVIDFLDFRIWPVFNVADTCITIGAVLMAWQMIRRR